MINKALLDDLYRRYNRREFVNPDPLQFLYDYPDVRDREIVGLIASSLAYGRVAQILKSVELVTSRVGFSPREFLDGHSRQTLESLFRGFRHRFNAHGDIVDLLIAVKKVIREYGSLNDCFISGLSKRDENVLPALESFVARLGCENNYLLPSPGRGSACKRLNLYLRWMVRKDAVDPGGWHGIPRSRLLVPLDTHMAKIGSMLGFTSRKTADMKMVVEITSVFREYAPRDPVRYDFALTRFGIRSDMNIMDLKIPVYNRFDRSL